jgi:radical SAM protein with 4Fe4S-binding SPASM domain
VFTGGEPLFRADFLRILDYACRLGFVTSVVTNGLLLNESLIRQLPKNNLRVTVSLDNLHFGEMEGLDSNRRYSFLQTRLLLLKQEEIACHVSATMTRENLPQLKTIFSWLIEQGIGFRTIPFTPIGRGALYPELQLSTAEVKQAAELWAMELANEEALQGTQGLTFSQCFDYALTLVYMCRACKGGRYIAYICANGDVYPCTTCSGVGAYQAGNITTSSFQEIWEDSFKGFRQLTRWDNFAECRKCPFSSTEYFCTNRCPPLALLYRGSPCSCGATAYDRSSLAYRTKLLHSIQEAGSANSGGTC